MWDGRRAAKLLDSIYKQMPIGSLFLWEVKRSSAHLIRQSTDVLPAFSTKNKHVWFVIDGQQRLSVIYRAAEAGVRRNDADREIDFGNLCFNTNTRGGDAEAARFTYRRPSGRDHVPVQRILANDWRNKMPSKSKTFLRVIRTCRQRLLSYEIPVIRVTSASLEEIGEVFIRINSQGMRITSADRAIALMGKLDVRAMASELRHTVREKAKFSIGSIDPILMGFNLISEPPKVDSDPPKLEVMAKRWSKRIEKDEEERKTFERAWHRFQRAFLNAVDYLRSRFPICDESYLPSANMLSTLAVFFYHQLGQPRGFQAREIRKWFWATGVGQRYSGRGYHKNIVADASFFSDLAKGKHVQFRFRDLLDPVVDVQGTQYASNSARTRAFFCLLARKRPCYLDCGGEIPLANVASHSNQRHRHHIFPKQQLSSRFSAAVYNTLCNICFLVCKDNTQIGMRLPRRYLAHYRERNGRALRRILRSHLIPSGEESGLWDRGVVRSFKAFRSARLKLICDEFEREAGMKLFRRR